MLEVAEFTKNYTGYTKIIIGYFAGAGTVSDKVLEAKFLVRCLGCLQLVSSLSPLVNKLFSGMDLRIFV
jgi:hypothetical protein